jgi:hypothetical protein
VWDGEKGKGPLFGGASVYWLKAERCEYDYVEFRGALMLKLVLKY